MKTLVILCSQRFKKEMYVFASNLEKLGVTVFRPEFENRDASMYSKEENERLKNKDYRLMVPGLVHAHLQRIREADVCYVFNPGGYVGVNTTLEIGFAHGLNKIIYTYENENKFGKGGELCRQILFNRVVKTPKELYKKLK